MAVCAYMSRPGYTYVAYAISYIFSESITKQLGPRYLEREIVSARVWPVCAFFVLPAPGSACTVLS